MLSLVASTTRAYAEENAQPARRTVISADEVRSAPAGYHPETRLRLGFVIGGGVVAGFGALMLATGLAQRADSQARQSNVPTDVGSDGTGYMMFGGGLLAVGVPLLVYGLVSPRDVYVRDAPTKVSFELCPLPQSPRAGLRLTF